MLELENEIPLSKYSSVLSAKNTNEEFQILDEVTYQKTHMARFYKEKAVLHLNRYTDILPCMNKIYNKYFW